ncbi:hypothetical protein [Nocardia sp. NPDC004604]|uniref:hypothetical protein n=1 Tax=Nocardia sp. NPDC004604 TaxID=3157013 RepID=UPI0033BF185C
MSALKVAQDVRHFVHEAWMPIQLQYALRQAMKLPAPGGDPQLGRIVSRSTGAAPRRAWPHHLPTTARRYLEWLNDPEYGRPEIRCSDGCCFRSDVARWTNGARSGKRQR